MTNHMSEHGKDAEWIVERIERVNDRIEALRRDLQAHVIATEKALKLQAKEYERRLDSLNHAYEEARLVAATVVGRDRFEEYVKTEANKVELALAQVDEKRETALMRVDEKFSDYITRYEADKREVDAALATMKGAAQEATRAVEDSARKTNRNIGIGGIITVLVIAVANYLGTF